MGVHSNRGEIENEEEGENAPCETYWLFMSHLSDWFPQRMIGRLWFVWFSGGEGGEREGGLLSLGGGRGVQGYHCIPS